MLNQGGIVRLLRIAAFISGFAAGLGGAPVITGVYNAASWLPPALPNSGVAQGAMFTVYGSGLGPSVLQQARSYPLPATQGLGGTTIVVTVGTVTKTCIMLYTVATQAAGILPSATPKGSGTLTVIYQGAKSSFGIEVVAASFGTFTLNESGTGSAVATDTSFNPITFVNAAHPGDTLVLWGTGLGAVSGDETRPPLPADLGTGVQVFVEGQPATVLYGGRSSFSGLDQINFIVPAGIGGGCKTSIAVLVKGVVGNVTSTSIAPAGQTTCGETSGALTSANLQEAVAKGYLSIATVDLYRFATADDQLVASFFRYPLSSLIQSYGGANGPSSGSCVSYEFESNSLNIVDPTVPPHLDSGPTLVLTGPGGAKTIAQSSMGSYASTLSNNASYIRAGGFSVTNGNGASNVAAFNWDLTLPDPVVPTNLPASFRRSQDLTLSWTAGAAFPIVSIFGYSGVPISPTQSSYVEFVCHADGAAGQFTIPWVILSLLPTNGYGSPNAPGVGLQIAGVSTGRFSVGGSPGIDAGIFNVFTPNGGVVMVQ